MKFKSLKKLCVAGFAVAALLIADNASQAATRSWFSPRCYQRSTTATPSTNSAQANRSSQRRYSFAPSGGTYSTPSYSGGTRGYSGGYNQGSGYSPRNGINRADFKIRGL